MVLFRSRLLASLCCLLVLSGSALAAEDYAALKARLASGDAKLDFRALRLAHAAAPDYAPNQAALLEKRRAVEQALKAEKYEEAKPLLESWLAADFLNPFAHLGAARVAEKTGNATQAAFHNAVVEGVFNSICAKGEGLSEDKPCQVLSIDEEHFYLVMNGFRLEGQHSLLCDGQQACEALDVTDPKTRKGYTIYMDISLPLNFLQSQKGSAEAPPPPPRAP